MCVMGVTLRPRRVCVVAWIWDGLEEEREAVDGPADCKGRACQPLSKGHPDEVLNSSDPRP